MNRLFVANKPIFISSNNFISRFKKKFKTKKVGYSGTLDPFASGCLIVATGQFTKLFPYLKKSPKIYEATLWLGADSLTLDIEGVREIFPVKKQNPKKIEKILNSLVGEIEYFPPKYSAKKIAGKKAYELARENFDFEMKKVSSKIYSIKLLNYSHPFIHFQAEVSEGTYIRSLGEIIAKKIGVSGALSSLKRVREGEFYFQGEKFLNPLKYLNIPRNFYKKDQNNLKLGKRLQKEDFEIQDNGIYFVESKDFFSVIQIEEEVKYKLNLIQKGEYD
jgi:tRNA pseudouridine55 synthase